jgi:hypothetical protein
MDKLAAYVVIRRVRAEKIAVQDGLSRGVWVGTPLVTMFKSGPIPLSSEMD